MLKPCMFSLYDIRLPKKAASAATMIPTGDIGHVYSFSCLHYNGHTLIQC